MRELPPIDGPSPDPQLPVAIGVDDRVGLPVGREPLRGGDLGVGDREPLSASPRFSEVRRRVTTAEHRGQPGRREEHDHEAAGDGQRA